MAAGSSRRCTTSSAGATKLYGAALYRLRPEDFGVVAHVDGTSPAWPLGYDDFEPWYTEAEWLYQVHGTRGEDPTEGPASRPYPWPAVSHEPRLQEISDALAAKGYHPFSAPCGILLDEADRARSACIRCAWCDGYPCLVHAKADAEVIAVRPLLENPNVTLLVNAEAVRLETDAAGHTVTAVTSSETASARSTPPTSSSSRPAPSDSAKLLLASANDAHPNGLANGSDQVGRNYMFHNCKAAVSLTKEPNDTVFQKTLGINDFYLAGDGRPWPLGNIQMVGKSNAGAMKGEEPKLTFLAPRWSLDDVAAARRRLVADDRGPPQAGEPGDRRQGGSGPSWRTPPPTTSEAEGLYGELKTILNHVGHAEHHVLSKNFYMSMDVPVAGVAHQAGTCRFGTDPSTSVLDVNCKAHELDNLYVVDTSFFPSIGAVNPALTAMANALRVGAHLTERL